MGRRASLATRTLSPQFKAEKFNADQWLSIFKQAGAKYIIPVAEHHDGFAMYKTKRTKWNAVDMARTATLSAS